MQCKQPCNDGQYNHNYMHYTESKLPIKLCLRAVGWCASCQLSCFANQPTEKPLHLAIWRNEPRWSSHICLLLSCTCCRGKRNPEVWTGLKKKPTLFWCVPSSHKQELLCWVLADDLYACIYTPPIILDLVGIHYRISCHHITLGLLILSSAQLFLSRSLLDITVVCSPALTLISKTLNANSSLKDVVNDRFSWSNKSTVYLKRAVVRIESYLSDHPH